MAKYSPETECKNVARELCGPSGCVLRPGPEECFDKKEVVVQEVIRLTIFNLKLVFVLDQNSKLDFGPKVAFLL